MKGERGLPCDIINNDPSIMRKKNIGNKNHFFLIIKYFISSLIMLI